MIPQQPLDEIRQLEAEEVRRIADARQAARERVRHASVQAGEIEHQAHEAGYAEGQVLAQQALAEAEKQARALVAQATREAEALRERGLERMQDAVHVALAIVLGQETEDDRTCK